LSSAYLTSEQVAKWVQHQRTQLEARTFDARTQATTISERSWTMIGFKIASSRTLRENPASGCRKEWNIDTFLKALEEVYSVEPADRFMETGSISQAICLDLGRDLVIDPADMAKLSEKYVAVLVERKLLHSIKEGTCIRRSRTCCTISSQETTQQRTPSPTEPSTQSSNKL